MRRRKFLIGAGSLAAGGSAVFGTAASTTFNLNDRGVSANIVADSSAAVQLRDQETQGSIVRENSGGELVIDFTADGNAQGVNVGSEVFVGDGGNPTSDAAFDIVNQTTSELDLSFEFVAGDNYAANSFSGGPDPGGSELNIGLRRDVSNNKGLFRLQIHGSSVPGPGDSKTWDVFSDSGPKDPLLPGERIAADIRFLADNSNSSTDENFSGDLNITATQD